MTSSYYQVPEQTYIDNSVFNTPQMGGMDNRRQLNQQANNYLRQMQYNQQNPWGYNPAAGQASNAGQASAGAAPGATGNPLYDSYQSAYDEARAANEQRYKQGLEGYQARTNLAMGTQAGNTDDILTGFENRYQRGMGQLEGLGTQEKKDLQQQAEYNKGANLQDMVNRGLTGTTILPTMRQGLWALPMIWRDKTPFAGFLRFSDWLHAETHATHGIALARLTGLVRRYLSENVGIAEHEIDVALTAVTRPVTTRSPPRQARHLAQS